MLGRRWTALISPLFASSSASTSAAAPRAFSTARPAAAHYLRPTLFAFGGTVAAFGLGVAAYDASQVKDVGRAGSMRDFFMRRQIDRAIDHDRTLKAIAETGALPHDAKKLATMVANRWYTLSEGQRTVAGLMAVNGVVFAAWQVPRGRIMGIMNRWFVHNPTSGRSVTLLTSAFSHQTALHFGMNMFGLWTVGAGLHSALGSRHEFLAFYTSAALVSGWVSHVLTLRTVAMGAIVGSLGASGALFACLGAFAILYPDVRVGIMFIPGVDFALKVFYPYFLQ
ncbi:hypothetical protein BC828DRAFT_379828 [Blastocladiella britannica]|nr:hypothetical protein BC828DRAFT_379828 [Blastocladiella britannica]